MWWFGGFWANLWWETSSSTKPGSGYGLVEIEFF
jgi:hypothetical protein